jgi:hypothetical protein
MTQEISPELQAWEEAERRRIEERKASVKKAKAQTSGQRPPILATTGVQAGNKSEAQEEAPRVVEIEEVERSSEAPTGTFVSIKVEDLTQLIDDMIEEAERQTPIRRTKRAQVVETFYSSSEESESEEEEARRQRKKRARQQAAKASSSWFTMEDFKQVAKACALGMVPVAARALVASIPALQGQPNTQPPGPPSGRPPPPSNAAPPL